MSFGTVAAEIMEPLGGTRALETVVKEIREPLGGTRALEIVVTEIRGLWEQQGTWRLVTEIREP